jgi:hypothetical protein
MREKMRRFERTFAQKHGAMSITKTLREISRKNMFRKRLNDLNVYGIVYNFLLPLKAATVEISLKS